jgi:hypothetical protein
MCRDMSPTASLKRTSAPRSIIQIPSQITRFGVLRSTRRRFDRRTSPVMAGIVKFAGTHHARCWMNGRDEFLHVACGTSCGILCIFPTCLHRTRWNLCVEILLTKPPPSVYEILLWQTENAICYNTTRPLDLNLVIQTDFRARDNGVVSVHFPPFDLPCFFLGG